jgi:uncharacterized protein YndB with AHSA1/START domain
MSRAVNSRVDRAERTAVITTTFDHPVDAVWALFSDPTKLARWWGPPGMPMTVDRHDLRPGGSVEVTVSADGEVIRGRWAIHEVAAPHTLSFTFSSDGLDPTEIAVAIRAASDGSTTMTLTARFGSDADLRHAMDIGFVDGLVRSCNAALDVVAGV